MGLFMQRPEEPTEWAGLPAEPLRPRSGAEMLPDDPQPGMAGADVLAGSDAATVTSISIPIPIPETVRHDGAAGDAASD